MQKGKIIKGIGGFYYVHTRDNVIYECRAKGIFRKNGIKPLVGDDVGIEILDEKEKTGNLMEILPRKNTLIRPAVANVDQALVIFAVNRPKPNFNLLDHFLVMMEYQKVKTVICFNKEDLSTKEELEELQRIYAGCESQVLFVSAGQEKGMEAERPRLWPGPPAWENPPSSTGSAPRPPWRPGRSAGRSTAENIPPAIPSFSMWKRTLILWIRRGSVP